ncbi:alpha/beta fold hydrolase [Rhizobium sp. BK251]|uniref:alpha/beta fold hydrolase n=1 Tax=Rhizobium sp. BK251 TaxID=2512125 RepID=UPI0010D3208D|nr:alpha/beta fold hydrolase [Rhizobium sp. BK251]TCL74839.1 pimeloyl-ACP methyl ester carboxylesterase [Rhizobium sp. BK251]
MPHPPSKQPKPGAVDRPSASPMPPWGLCGLHLELSDIDQLTKIQQSAERGKMTLQFDENRHSAAIANSTMSYIDVGQGPVVVLGHSYLFDASMWRYQIEALSHRYRLIVPELWGHGKSGALPAGTKDMQDVARQHLALLDHLKIDKFGLVGMSVGGMWGAEIAMTAPERVKALALLDTYLGAEPKEKVTLYLSMLATVEALGSVPDPMVEALVPMVFSQETIEKSPQFADEFRENLRQAPSERIVDSIVPIGRLTFGRRDAMTDLRELTLPSLVMTGEKDISRPVDEGREMADALNCLFVEVPDAGHMSALEAPQDVNTHLLAFLGNAMRT